MPEITYHFGLQFSLSLLTLHVIFTRPSANTTEIVQDLGLRFQDFTVENIPVVIVMRIANRDEETVRRLHFNRNRRGIYK